MKSDNKKLRFFLIKFKSALDNYRAREAKTYLNLLLKENYQLIEESVLLFLLGKYYLLINEEKLALEYLGKIKKGINFHNAKYLIAKTYFANSDFSSGDDLFISRLKRGKFTDRVLYLENILIYPEWNFEKNSKVLLWQDFAIGETTLIFRLLSSIDTSTNEITILLDPRLIPLYQITYPNFKYLNYDSFKLDDNFDYQLQIGSLIKILKRDLSPLNHIPVLKVDHNYEKKKNICIFFSGRNSKNSEHRSIPDDIILRLLKPFKDHTFTIINYGDSKEHLKQLLDQNDFKLIEYDGDIFNDFLNLSKVLLTSQASIMTSCSEAYISGAIGAKTIVLYNKKFSSTWLWQNHLNNNKNLWFKNLYSFDFITNEGKYLFDSYERITNIINSD